MTTSKEATSKHLGQRTHIRAERDPTPQPGHRTWESTHRAATGTHNNYYGLRGCLWKGLSTQTRGSLQSRFSSAAGERQDIKMWGHTTQAERLAATTVCKQHRGLHGIRAAGMWRGGQQQDTSKRASVPRGKRSGQEAPHGCLGHGVKAAATHHTVARPTALLLYTRQRIEAHCGANTPRTTSRPDQDAATATVWPGQHGTGNKAPAAPKQRLLAASQARPLAA